MAVLLINESARILFRLCLMEILSAQLVSIDDIQTVNTMHIQNHYVNYLEF